MSEELDEQLNRIDRLAIRDFMDGPLAYLVEAVTKELASRFADARRRDLDAAKAIWPQLEAALKAAGRRFNGMLPQGIDSRPWLPDWSTEPGVYLERQYTKKPKTKAEAMRLALTYGDGGFASVSELWLWVAGGGPIVDRAMYEFGYFGKRPKPEPAWRIKSQ